MSRKELVSKLMKMVQKEELYESDAEIIADFIIKNRRKLYNACNVANGYLRGIGHGNSIIYEITKEALKD